MADGLDVQPVIRATGEIRRASSACCGALLQPDGGPSGFGCTACGQPCERVLGDAEQAEFRG